MVVRPERSLAVRCPEVAALWHPTWNTGWTPHTISVASDVLVWWGCPDGHAWMERVRDRAALRKWKRGDVAACGVCVGVHALEVCACGRGRLIRATVSPSAYECLVCSRARRQELRERWEEQRRREAARTDYVADFDEGEALLGSIAPAHLPSALLAEWRRAVRGYLHGGMVNERGYGELSTSGAIEAALRRIQDMGDLAPAVEELRAAHAAGEPIRFMGRTFWTQGVVHVLEFGAPRWPRDVVAAASLERWVRAGLRRVINHQRPAASYSTAALTRVITDLVEHWGHNDPTGAWRSFFELVPPFIPSSGSLCGQMDVVLTRAGSPDLVVEIDSAHRVRSMEKLCFAQAAGATAVWIRWHRGATRTVPGVHVIDLVAQTKVTRPTAGAGAQRRR